MPQVDRLLHRYICFFNLSVRPLLEEMETICVFYLKPCRASLEDNALETDGPVFGGCDNNM